MACDCANKLREQAEALRRLALEQSKEMQAMLNHRAQTLRDAAESLEDEKV